MIYRMYVGMRSDERFFVIEELIFIRHHHGINNGGKRAAQQAAGIYILKKMRGEVHAGIADHKGQQEEQYTQLVVSWRQQQS